MLTHNSEIWGQSLHILNISHFSCHFLCRNFYQAKNHFGSSVFQLNIFTLTPCHITITMIIIHHFSIHLSSTLFYVLISSFACPFVSIYLLMFGLVWFWVSRRGTMILAQFFPCPWWCSVIWCGCTHKLSLIYYYVIHWWAILMYTSTDERRRFLSVYFNVFVHGRPPDISITFYYFIMCLGKEFSCWLYCYLRRHCII